MPLPTGRAPFNAGADGPGGWVVDVAAARQPCWATRTRAGFTAAFGFAVVEGAAGLAGSPRTDAAATMPRRGRRRSAPVLTAASMPRKANNTHTPSSPAT